MQAIVDLAVVPAAAVGGLMDEAEPFAASGRRLPAGGCAPVGGWPLDGEVDAVVPAIA